MEETKKTPRHGELVITTISKITNFGAYCKLVEYGDMEAFLPIREISSGWIKNIREYVHEGQKLVCYVNSIDKEKGTIDVSLKRVSAKDQKDKIRAYNLEKRLGALFLQALKKTNEVQTKDALISTVVSEFNTYTNMVQNATSNTKEFTQSKLPKKIKDALLKIIEANRKQKRYFVSYVATIYTYNTESGASELREIMDSVKKMGVEVGYIGAPKYQLFSEGTDYADAESKIAKARGLIESKIKNGVFELEKEKLKKDKEDIMSAIVV
jgi:translation initiation factor 2 alpha subunit (eIF-2alpha)